MIQFVIETEPARVQIAPPLLAALQLRFVSLEESGSELKVQPVIVVVF